MAELAFEGNEKIEVSDYELAQPGISYTINTLEHLKEIYPDNELFSYAEQILFWKWKSGGWEKISLRIFLLQSASGPVTDRKNYAGRFQNMKENMQPTSSGSMHRCHPYHRRQSENGSVREKQ